MYVAIKFILDKAMKMKWLRQLFCPSLFPLPLQMNEKTMVLILNHMDYENNSFLLMMCRAFIFLNKTIWSSHVIVLDCTGCRFLYATKPKPKPLCNYVDI